MIFFFYHWFFALIQVRTLVAITGNTQHNHAGTHTVALFGRVAPCGEWRDRGVFDYNAAGLTDPQRANSLICMRRSSQSLGVGRDETRFLGKHYLPVRPWLGQTASARGLCVVNGFTLGHGRLLVSVAHRLRIQQQTQCHRIRFDNP